MHGVLPALHGFRHARSSFVASRALPSPCHDHIDRAVDADQIGRQASQPTSTIGQYVERSGMTIVMAEIGYNVDPLSAEGCHRVIEPAIERHHHWLEVWTLATGSQSDSGQQMRWGRAHQRIDTQVHPIAGNVGLHGRRYRTLAGAWGSVEYDDAAKPHQAFAAWARSIDSRITLRASAAWPTRSILAHLPGSRSL